MLKSIMIRTLSLVFISLSAAFVLPPLPAQEVRFFYINRGEAVYQTRQNITISIKDFPAFRFDFPNYFLAGAELLSGEFSRLALEIPGVYGLVEAGSNEPGSWGINLGFTTVDNLITNVPEGLYVFSGESTGLGSFSESVELATYNPIAIKRITNYNDLQSVAPGADVVIQWEPFTEATGNDGFINVDVSYWDGSQKVFLWSSETLVSDGSLGLPPETTSVTVPGELISGSPFGIYHVSIGFSRIDKRPSTVNFQDGSEILVATSSRTISHFIVNHDDLQRIFLTPGVGSSYSFLGTLFPISEDWAFNFHFGLFDISNTPEWISLEKFGWLQVPNGGSISRGLWFYSPEYGWVYVDSDWQGWCYSPSLGWNYMPSPLEAWLF